MPSISKLLIVLFIAITLIPVASCKKNDVGGKAEIHAIIFHGATPIIGTTTLYVKFNATSQPSNPLTDFDLKVSGEPDDNHVHIENLRPGNYYCYALAFDSVAMMPVHGGIATTIKWSERKQTKDVELQTTN